MYGKKKKAIKVDTTTKKLAFHQFVPWARVGDSDQNAMYALDSRNCNCLDGSMRVGIGMKTHTNSSGSVVKYPIADTEVDCFFFSHKHTADGSYKPMLCCLAKNGDYYFTYWESTSFIQHLDLQFGKVEQIDYFLTVDKEPYVMVFGSEGIMAVQVEVAKKAKITESVQCGCVLNDRVYAVIDPYTLVYSAPLEPLTYTLTIHDSGRLYIPRETGDAVAIKPLDGKLYLFSDYGITEIEPSGSAMDFKQKKISYQGERILKGSVGECNGKIYFFALDGVYAFDGKHTEKKFKNLHLRGKDATQKCSWAAYGNGFLLRYCDENNTYRTVYLDPEKDSGYRTMDLCGLSMADGQAVCGRNKMVYYIGESESLPIDEESFFFSESINFGSRKPKVLNGLRIAGEGTAVVDILSGDEKATYSIDLSNGAVDLQPNLVGKEFRFKFVLNSGGAIHNVEAEAECLK